MKTRFSNIFILLFIIAVNAVSFISCSKKTNTPSPPSPQNTTTTVDSFYNEAEYFSFIANSDTAYYTSGPYDNSARGHFAVNTGTIYSNGYYSDFSKISLRFSFSKSGMLKSPSALDSNDWKQFLNIGTYPFASCNDFCTGINPGTYCPGIYIRYKDKNDTVWYSTTPGNSNQSFSNFTITKSKFYYSPTNSLLKFKGTFNCVLYSASGNTLSIPNGKFVQGFWL